MESLMELVSFLEEMMDISTKIKRWLELRENPNLLEGFYCSPDEYLLIEAFEIFEELSEMDLEEN